MSPLQRQSALAHRRPLATTGQEVTLDERAFEGKLILRGRPEIVGGAVHGVLGAALPASVHETATCPLGIVQWLSPDEWLIVTAPGAESAIAANLAQPLTGLHAQIVDVTDYYTTIRLTGARARDVLMKVATIDFHPRAFKPGMAVTTNFGRAVAWARLSGESAFDIIVRISMADYLWCLLAEAGREWGLPPQTPKGSDVKLHLPHLEAPTQSDAMITGSDLEIA